MSVSQSDSPRRRSHNGRALPARALRAAQRRWMGTITHVATAQPVVALTFDDGPHPEYTPRLLEVLARHGAHATFFVVGEGARDHPRIIRAAAEAGHTIGNHSWDHPSMPRIGRGERREQIRACARAIAPYGTERLFRPPFGHQSPASRLDLWLLGYKVVTWNAHCEDWLDHSAAVMADELERKIVPGGIVCMHDRLFQTIEPRYADRMPTVKAVDLILQRLKDRYRFVTVPEMLKCGRPHLKSWVNPGDIAWLNALNEGQTRQY